MKRLDILCFFVLLVIGLCIYGQTVRYGYNIDDYLVVENLEMVEHGLEGVHEIFTSNYSIEDDGSSYGYRPLTRLSFALEYEFLPAPPAFSHAINVLLFSLNAILLYVLLMLLFGEKARFAIFCASAFFLVHPLHTEIACSLKNREEILSMLLCLSSLIIICRFLKNYRWHLLPIVFVLYLLAILAKISAIPFIAFAVLCSQIIQKKYLDVKIMAVLTVYLLPIMCYFLFLAIYMPDNGRVPGISADGVTFQKKHFYTYPENPLDTPEYDSFSKRLGTAAACLTQYGIATVYPSKLLCYYGLGTITVAPISDVRALFSALLHGLLLILGLCLFWKRELIGLGILFYLAALFPYLNIIAPTPGIYAERLSYFPHIGTTIILCGVIWRLIQYKPKLKTPIVAVAIGYLFLLSAKSFDRARDWSDKFTLLEADLAKQSDNLIISVLLYREHEKAVQVKDGEAKMEHIRKMIQIAYDMIKVDERFFVPHFYLARQFRYRDPDRYQYHRKMLYDYVDHPINRRLKHIFSVENTSLQAQFP